MSSVQEPGENEREHQPLRAGLSRAGVVLAFLVLWFALVVPDELSAISPLRLLRIPIEGLLLVALFLVLPSRPARILAAAAGIVLGLLTSIKLINGGFYETLDRPAHLATDWPLIGSAFDYVHATAGRPLAILAAVLVVVILIGVTVGMVAALETVKRVVRRRQMGAARPVSVLAVAWAVAAVLGQPVADRSTADLVVAEAGQVHADLRDRADFASSLRAAGFQAAPAQTVLSGLRGKDVILVFVESYGRSAIEDPDISPGVDAVLASGTKKLAAAGYHSRSAFLTSSTAGGGSWLAHSTFLSGTWVNSPARYTTLLNSTRTTLVRDFDNAGWTTRATMPGTQQSWPEGSFYGYQRIDTGDEFGYRGTNFGWSPMPDQYTLSWVAAHDLQPGHTPLFLDVELTSSHHPWTPLPSLVPWSQVGDGSVYGPMAAAVKANSPAHRSAPQIKADYGQSIQYSLSSLFSFVRNHGDKNTVMIFLGDHQPAPVITGNGASRDVPVAIVAHDPAVLDQISSWGWQAGMDPSAHAPVWRMDTFRNRFLSAYSVTDGGSPTGGDAPVAGPVSGVVHRVVHRTVPGGTP